MNEQRETLSRLYRIRFHENFLERKQEIWRVLTTHFFSKFISPDDRVLDLACGYGEFINNIQCGGKFAVDLNPETPTLLNEDIVFIESSADELSQNLNEKVDVVFTSNFLEHLRTKEQLDLVLSNVRAVLEESGKLIIMGPNLRCVPGAYWDYYDHHLGLTEKSLSEALQLSGFDVVYVKPRFLPYTTQGSLPTHPILVRLYLNFPVVWPLLGKQFFIVAQPKSS